MVVVGEVVFFVDIIGSGDDKITGVGVVGVGVGVLGIG